MAACDQLTMGASTLNSELIFPWILSSLTHSPSPWVVRSHQKRFKICCMVQIHLAKVDKLMLLGAGVSLSPHAHQLGGVVWT